MQYFERFFFINIQTLQPKCNMIETIYISVCLYLKQSHVAFEHVESSRTGRYMHPAERHAVSRKAWNASFRGTVSLNAFTRGMC